LNNNALPVVAMGNANSDFVGDLGYWYSALSVGAVDQRGAKASFSNFGLQTDVTAPGVAVLSTMPTYPVTLNTQYGYKTSYDALSGTSMATPVVPGLAGLVLSKNPALTASQVKGMIESSSGDGAAFDLTSGFGPVHAAAAITSAVQAENVPPALNFLSPAFGSVLVRNVTFSTAASDNVAVHHVDFISSGARHFLPATSVGYGGGKGKHVSPAIAPWSSLLPIPPSPSNGSNGSIRVSRATTLGPCPGGSPTASVFFPVASSQDTGRAMSSNMILAGRSSAEVARPTGSAAPWGISIFASTRIALSHRERLKRISRSPSRTRSNRRSTDLLPGLIPSVSLCGMPILSHHGSMFPGRFLALVNARSHAP
jgi:subtilisin family serine protease